MTPYTRNQRKQQAAWKGGWRDLPEAARADGAYDGIPCSFILPPQHARLNLWDPIRVEALNYFQAEGIVWHDGDNTFYGNSPAGSPSPHLLDSQICAVNFWWGLGQSSSGLTTALKAVFDNVVAAVSPEPGGPLAEPEWIGKRNYMGEHGNRRRGQYATSADVLIAYQDQQGGRHGVLIESKYTETYAVGESLRWSERGTDRAEIYRSEVERSDGPIRTGIGIEIEDLMFDPFDQHLRQQLLASAMEREQELGFETVTCLHVSPHANLEFHRRITAPKLQGRGDTVGEVWRTILSRPQRYRSIAYEDLFGAIANAGDTGLADWVGYQETRYAWNRDPR